MAREMKDSGVEWIGEIPREWETIKNKYILKEIYSGGTPTSSNENFYSDKGIPFVSIGDMNLKGKIYETKKYLTDLGIKDKNLKILNEDTILYSIYATIGNVSQLGIKSAISQALLALTLYEKKYNKNFYKYNLIAMKEFVMSLSNGNTQNNLNAERVKNFLLVFPPLEEQEKIANYLDKKVSDIDLIIEKTKATIEDYKKYKQSIITEAVTKGINSNVEMKDSGNIYIGKIPKKWQMKKIKYLFLIKKDIAGKIGFNILSITQKGIKIKDTTTNEGQMSMDYSKYQLLNVGEFAMNHMDLLTGWVDISKYDGVTSPDYRVFKLIDEKNNSKNYYLYFMQICYSNKIFYGLGQGVSSLGRWRLQSDKFMNFVIPVPPLEEQNQIAEYLDKKTSEIDTLITKKEALITELEEYKKSLIYECVTGKKEIK